MQNERGIGLVLGSSVAPERLSAAAAGAEAGGFDELWLAEDFFFTGGISAATAVLAATNRIGVGLGVVSAVARHPALLAMEIATVSRMFPGRLTAGVGLGVPAWIRQMGLYPPTALGAVRECVTGVRRLLRGEELTEQGRVFEFDRVRLTYPEGDQPTPIHMGVSGPKMLRLSGEIADGTVLSVAASTEYVQWARERIEEGRAIGGRTAKHRVTVFALYSVDGDEDVARAAVRRPLAFYKSNGPNALTDVAGISDQLRDILDRGGYDRLVEEMPESWVERLTIAGTPEHCAARIRAFHEAGADSVALFPMPSDQVDRVVRLTADEVLPRLTDR
jgi:alkanesulfonate monooxygenase SsuD/methylene tetrahydromethanopterin reductase-like flavin-dependent oxidoreductase (luciferase family)